MAEQWSSNWLFNNSWDLFERNDARNSVHRSSPTLSHNQWVTTLSEEYSSGIMSEQFLKCGIRKAMSLPAAGTCLKCFSSQNTAQRRWSLYLVIGICSTRSLNWIVFERFILIITPQSWNTKSDFLREQSESVMWDLRNNPVKEHSTAALHPTSPKLSCKKLNIFNNESGKRGKACFGLSPFTQRIPLSVEDSTNLK